MSLYWLQQTIAVLPLVSWVYFGLGIPFALLALPRRDWSQIITVLALSFAFGPALLTAWMFILGTIGGATESRLFTFELVFGGTIIIAATGYFLVWRKRNRTSAPDKVESTPLAFDEKILILIIAVAVLVRFVVTSYWSFTAYDTLWVYGYEGRLYQLLGSIPQEIGYYPQFIPLQYTFFQLLSDGFNDHAARAIVPFLHVGSILAAYVMGKHLFTRRVGIIAASVWTLYPHVAQWAHVGDLEIPLTFLLTLTMTFFLMAWMQDNMFLRRRYALIAGLCFGIAMWTKPTAGAFIWGVMLLVIAEFVRVRFDYRAWFPRFEVAAITGIASIPLGAVWYIRNLALGLPALVFPHESWLNRATRSGDLLSWLILALLLTIVYLASTRKLQYGWVILVGVLLTLAGAIPSSPLFNPLRRDPPMSYLTLPEITLIVAGLALIVWSFRVYLFGKLHQNLRKIAWAYLLILPYFITWFWSYSYHARLSFPIVPILLLPSALVLSLWLPTSKVSAWHKVAKFAFSSLLILISIPSILTPIFRTAPTYDWLWTNRYPDDFSRTRLHNPGVALVAEQLWGYQAFHGTTPIVIAPGEQRLRFFLPEATIITDTVPTRYEELAGASHFIYGSQARWRYENDEGIAPLSNRVVASLGRDNIFQQVLDFDSGTFEYELYELHLDTRYAMPEGGPAGHQIEDAVIFGDSIRYVGDVFSNNQLQGNRIALALLWDVLETPQGNYHVRIDLLNTEDGEIYRTWQSPVAPTEHAYYNTELWETGEFVIFNYSILEDVADLPNGANIYRFVVNLIDIETDEIVPMTINGDAAQGYTVELPFSVGE